MHKSNEISIAYQIICPMLRLPNMEKNHYFCKRKAFLAQNPSKKQLYNSILAYIQPCENYPLQSYNALT